MIKDNKAVSMAEVTQYLSKEEDSDAALLGFIKKLTKLKPDKAKELKKKLEELDIIKINEKQICKMADFLPETSEELNKITSDIGLDEDETKKILETIKKSK